jgi:hypothetical protein
MKLLKFGDGNSKLPVGIMTFSLPASYSCPGANQCRSQAVKTSVGFRIKDGPNCEFRCFAAIDEVLKRNVREARWHNFNLLKACRSTTEMVELITMSLPPSPFNLPIRLHVSGDFFNQMYFDAWLKVTRMFPERIFYGYSKSLLVWIARKDNMPANFKLVASRGGKWDNLIETHKLRSAKVVYSEAEAISLGLSIDHDDSHCYKGTGDFALLLHGTQPAGTETAKAWQALKKIGKGGYHNQKRGRGWGGKDYAGQPLKKNYGGSTPSPKGMKILV